MNVIVEVMPGGKMPAKGTPHAVGYDCYAAERKSIPSGKRALVRLGFRCQIPPGNEVQIRPRSGLALRHGITVLNSPGTIDPDYRGEVCAILVNLGEARFDIEVGDRVCQAVPTLPLTMVCGVVSDETDRGYGGFGSTGR